MKSKWYTVVMCEGLHDIAFITRILKMNGYSDEGGELDKLDKRFRAFFTKHLNKRKERIGFISDFKIPHTILKKDGNVIFFHKLEGDQRQKNREELKKNYLKLTEFDEAEDEYFEKISYRFLYFLDADDKLVEERVGELKTELNLEEFSPISIKKKEGQEYGCYIFCNENNKKGKLEDILLKVIRENDKNKYDEVKCFLDKLEEKDKSTTKRYNDIENKYEGSSKYDRYKTKLGILGQLKISGVANQVIIQSTDYFKRENVEKLNQYNDILKLFEKV